MFGLCSFAGSTLFLQTRVSLSRWQAFLLCVCWSLTLLYLNFISFIPLSLLCYGWFSNVMMGRNDESKSPSEAKISRRKVPARMKPGPAVPEPRDLGGGGKGNGPATVGELLGQRVDEGEKAANPPFILVTFPTSDEPVLSSKQGRPRRCYDAQERREVADTRRRGACDACRMSKTKCRHNQSKIATEKYRTQCQSHELFALGLTTESLTANEHEHKQVMEEKIAAFDHTLVKAQNDPARQDKEANHNGGVKAAAVVGPMSPPDTGVPKGPTSYQQNHTVEVHQTRARQTTPIPFQQGMGMGMFKLKDVGTRPGRKGLPNKGNSKPTTDTPSGMKPVETCKASASPQPIVCQQSTGSVASPTALKQPYNKNLTTWRPSLQGNITERSATTSNNIQPGYKALQQPFSKHLEAPSAFSPQSTPERLSPRRYSNISDPDNNTMVTDESMLSLGRSPSPFSELSSSKPPSFVQLSDLEHSKSQNRVVPDSQIALRTKHAAHEQTPAVASDDMDLDDSDDIPSSFEEFLNADWDETTPVSKSTATDFATSQSGLISLDGSASKAVLREPKWVDITDPMEIDT